MEQLLKQPGPPTEPKHGHIDYNGKQVEAEIILVREYSCNQDYALVRHPHTRPFTRISVVKTQQYPINDSDIPSNVKKWFR